MRRLPRILGLSLLALSLSWPAFAEPPRSIKIGVLNDASGPYSDNAGEGSVSAAKMAAEDFMQKHPDFKVEIIAADHQNKAVSGLGSRADGSIGKTSMRLPTCRTR